MFSNTALASRRVLVTAGASGIGLAIAQKFAAAGARLFICDVDEAALSAALRQLPQAQGVICDVSDEQAVVQLFSKADASLGGLDILVNNAGVAGPTGPVESLSKADWDRTLAVNITGQFLCAREAVPRLRQGVRPSIINLSSAAGHLGFARRSPYSASKWAVVGFTKSLALELGQDGIRVNAILPGAVDGPRIRAVIQAKAESLGQSVEDMTRIYASQSALGRMVTAEDIANMALFAASDAAINVNGQALAVDGLTQALS